MLVIRSAPLWRCGLVWKFIVSGGLDSAVLYFAVLYSAVLQSTELESTQLRETEIGGS